MTEGSAGMARLVNAVNGVGHVEGIEVAFHGKAQLVLGRVLEFDMESCEEPLEGAAWDDNQLCDREKRVGVGDDEMNVFRNGGDIEVSWYRLTYLKW